MTGNIEPLAGGGMPRAQSGAMLSHEGGLHARPAIKVTQLAKRYAANVWIGLSEQGPWIDAKSIALVMKMKTPNNTMLHFAAEGADAENAVNSLARLVGNDFASAAGDA